MSIYAAKRDQYQDQPRTPFADYAPVYHGKGIHIIPLHANGKDPAVKGFSGTRYSLKTVTGWASRPSMAQGNIAILLALSGLAVVDIDCRDFNLLHWVLGELGDTPAIVETKRGWHLYYGASGLTAFHLRPRHDIDVKAGPGAYVVAPGSVRDGFEYHAQGNVTVQEFIDLLADVPSPAADDWEQLKGSEVTLSRSAQPHRPTSRKVVKLGGTISEGCRNDTLWREAMRVCHLAANVHGHTQAGLEAALSQMDGINADHCSVALEEGELSRLTRSAWKYQIEGKNWIGLAMEAGTMQRPAHARPLPASAQSLSCSGQALLSYLMAHWRDTETFPVNVPGLANDNALLLSIHAIKGAKRELREQRFIVQVRDYIRPAKGQKGRAAHWRFTDRVTLANDN